MQEKRGKSRGDFDTMQQKTKKYTTKNEKTYNKAEKTYNKTEKIIQ